MAGAAAGLSGPMTPVVQCSHRFLGTWRAFGLFPLPRIRTTPWRFTDDEHPELLVVPDVPQIGSPRCRAGFLSARESKAEPRTGGLGAFSSIVTEDRQWMQNR